MVKVALILFVVVFVICISLLAYKYGRSDAYRNEYNVCHAALLHRGLEHNTVFYEYLKARYYYLAHYVSDAVFRGALTDFGPVDTKGFDGIPIGKDAVVPSEDYLQFKQRIDRINK